MAWQLGGFVLGAVLAGAAALAGIVLLLHIHRARRQQTYVEYEETPVQRRVRYMHPHDRDSDTTQPIPVIRGG